MVRQTRISWIPADDWLIPKARKILIGKGSCYSKDKILEVFLRGEISWVDSKIDFASEEVMGIVTLIRWLKETDVGHAFNFSPLKKPFTSINKMQVVFSEIFDNQVIIQINFLLKSKPLIYWILILHTVEWISFYVLCGRSYYLIGSFKFDSFCS